MIVRTALISPLCAQQEIGNLHAGFNETKG